LIAGDLPAFDPAINLSAENLVGTKMTWSRSAIRNAFLCLLAHRDPVHLVNNNRLDLTNGGISDFTSAEKHHIFPQAFLGRSNYGEEQVHALPNFCFMPAELNRRILDARPSDYFAQLRMQNGQFAEAAHTHLIPINDDSGLANNEYLTFLKVRSGLILAEIEQLMGLSTTPRADQRQEAVERVETQVRNLIHNTLSDAHGPDYWRTAIPEDVRIEAEKRIASTLHKQPGLSAQKFTNAREKLSFCNIPDYLKLILIRNNWPHFEPVIRRKVDVERHLEAFSEFRNALMHGRPVTEFTRKAGELAMIWLELVISAQNEESSDAEQEDDAPDVSARVEPKKSKDVSAAKPVGVEEKMDGI